MSMGNCMGYINVIGPMETYGIRKIISMVICLDIGWNIIPMEN
jgi:hypothetical protein